MIYTGGTNTNTKKGSVWVFKHTDADGDGAGAVIIDYLMHNSNFTMSEIETVGVNYESWVIDKFNDVPKNALVYIVDYSVTEDTIEIFDILAKKNATIIWIDHHSSSIKLCKNHPNIFDEYKIAGIISKDHSGAMLAYMWVYGITDELQCPMFIRYISDYDTFQKRIMPESRQFILGLAATNRFSEIMTLLRLNRDNPELCRVTEEKYVSDGEIIEKYITTENEILFKSKSYEAELDDGTIICLVNDSNDSYVFGDNIEKYDACCIWTFNGKTGKFQHTIFSKESSNFKCDEFAEKYGGGGHIHAAGFSTDEMIFNRLTKKD